LTVYYREWRKGNDSLAMIDNYVATYVSFRIGEGKIMHHFKAVSRIVNTTAVTAMGVMTLSACASMQNAEPKYPIYMQDRPPATAPHPMGSVPAASPQAAAPVEAAPVAAPSGQITSAPLAALPTPAPAPAAATLKPAVPQTVTAAKPVATTKTTYVYTVQAKDTLYGISRRFGVPLKTLMTHNGLAEGAGLSIGQKLKLPDAAKDAGAVAHATGPAPAKVVTTVAVAQPKPATPTTPKPEVKVTTTVAVSEPAKPTTTTVTTTTAPVAKPVEKPVDTAVNKPVVAKAGTFPTSSTLAQMGKGRFLWPVKGPLLVPYGQLGPNVRNDGINIGASEGAEVRAAADGEVVYVGGHVKELGNTIYVQHGNGWYTGYSHLDKMDVKTNQKIQKGEVIGRVGKTGAVEKPQLHFEIRYTPSTEIAKPIDPNLVLP
jgi:murein DD-endopeptidase MepM/ murein hydrolase activator NlpD